jgi:hypothetical protein
MVTRTASLRVKPTFQTIAKAKKGKPPKQLDALTKHLYDHEKSLLSQMSASNWNLYDLAVNPPKPKVRPPVPVFAPSSRASSRSLSYRSTSPMSRDESRSRVASLK